MLSLMEALPQQEESCSSEEDMRIIRDALTIFFVKSDSVWSDFLNCYGDKITDVALRCFEKADIELPHHKLNSISLIFTNDEDIHNINREWREVDKPTNVLSFPTYSPLELSEKTYLQDPEIIFGDVIFAWDYCLLEAKNANISFLEHIIHLVIHGILHILGYDHIEANEAKLMESLEILILAEFGFENPY